MTAPSPAPCAVNGLSGHSLQHRAQVDQSLVPEPKIPGLVNVDFADVRAIMANAGSSLMGIGTATGGSDELKFVAYGDMGKAPRDSSAEHYIQPGSLSVIKATADEVDSKNVDSVFHIGDISYATGFLVEWDFFIHQISPVASRVSYMTAIGNHERDYISSGSVYITPDSGGECGIPYETYFPMPTPAKDKPWYSIEQASVHFVVISTEHDWSENSEQAELCQNESCTVRIHNYRLKYYFPKEGYSHDVSCIYCEQGVLHFINLLT